MHIAHIVLLLRIPSHCVLSFHVHGSKNALRTLLGYRISPLVELGTTSIISKQWEVRAEIQLALIQRPCPGRTFVHLLGTSSFREVKHREVPVGESTYNLILNPAK